MMLKRHSTIQIHEYKSALCVVGEIVAAVGLFVLV